MKLSDFQLENMDAWLADAPPELLLMILERLFKGDAERFRKVVKEAWGQFLQSPDRRQHRQICDNVG